MHLADLDDLRKLSGPPSHRLTTSTSMERILNHAAYLSTKASFGAAVGSCASSNKTMRSPSLPTELLLIIYSFSTHATRLSLLHTSSRFKSLELPRPHNPDLRNKIELLLYLKAGNTPDHTLDSTLLLRACLCSLKSQVSMLLHFGASTELADRTRKTPLLVSKSLEISTLLVRHGANLDGCAKNGLNCVHRAVQLNSLPLLQYLLDQIPADSQLLNGLLSTGESPLFLAVQGGNSRIVRLLLSRSCVAPPIRNGWTVMHAAIGSNPAVFEMILEIGDLNAQDSCGICPLHVAVKAKNSIYIGRLLQMGASRSLATRSGRQILDDVRGVLCLSV